MRFITLILSCWTLWGLTKRCSNPVLRKEVRELSTQELHRFANAVNKLHATPRPGTNLSEYEYFSYLHNVNSDYAHLLPTFLPWHRYFLRKWEKELQKIDPLVVLPYWDWALDSQAPEKSLILSSKLFGGDGNPNDDFCIQSGFFANWTMNVPDRHCLRRSYDRINKISKFAYPEEILLYLNEPEFSKFSFQLEDKHAFPHVFIGGPKGDFLPMWSPNDPLFILHHTFIDLLWAKWQSLHPHAIQYDGVAYNVTAKLSDTFIPFRDINVKSTLDTRDEFYCYEYPEYPRIINAKPKHQTKIDNLFKTHPLLPGGSLHRLTTVQAIDTLRDMVFQAKMNTTDYTPRYPVEISGPFSDKWVVELGVNFDHFRMTSDNSVILADLFNQLPGFISIANYHHLLD